MKQYIRFSLFLSIILCSTIISAQNAFYDAQLIASNKRKIATLYKNYQENYQKKAPNLNKIPTEEQKIINAFFDFVQNKATNADALDIAAFNNLTDKYRDFNVPKSDSIKTKKENAGDDPEESVTVKSESNFGSGFQASGVNVHLPNVATLPSKVVDATAQFLVKRAKAELTIAFFDQFREKVSKNKFLAHSFPCTYDLLRYQDYFTTPALNKTWLAAFDNDLSQIHFHLADYLEKEQSGLLQKPEIKLFTASVRAHQFLNEGVNPTEILQLMRDRMNLDTTQNAGKNAVDWIATLSNNLLAYNENEKASSSKIWISPVEFNNLGEDGQRLFWRLLQLKNPKLFQRLQLNQLDKLSSQTLSIYGQDVVTTFQNFEELYKNLPAATFQNKNDSTVLAQYLTYSQQVFLLLDLGFRAEYQLNNNLSGYYKSDYFKVYRPLTQNVINLIQFTQQKKWQLSMLCLVQLIEALHLKEYGMDDKTLQQFLYYASFITDIALASKDAASIENVIDRYAMPVGSYRVKRNREFSIDLNAYPGAYLGKETLQNSTTFTSGVGGVTAPIGLAFSIGKKQSNAFSLFVPLVDIGAAFSYRWKNEATGFPNQLAWEQIFAPGAYFVWNVRRMPMSVLVGGQYTPALRSITDAQTAVIQKYNAIRIGATLSVDIPIFNFYSK